MPEVLKLRLGSNVGAKDGDAGVLRRFVLRREKYVVTHLDVSSRRHGGRLVPIQSVEEADTVVQLACTLAQFSRFGPDVVDVETRDLSKYPAHVYNQDDLIHGRRIGSEGSGFQLALIEKRSQTVTSPTLPDGETDLRRRARVYATDGHVGHADGLIVDQKDFRATHLLLGEGHVFGMREIAIPITALVDVGADGTRLSLSKAKIRSLASAG